MTLTQYLDSALLRANLEIDETVSPEKVNECVVEANQVLDVELKPYADRIPYDMKDIKFGQIRKCALHYARKIWFSGIMEYDVANEEKEQYGDLLAAIKQSFMADRTTRTITVVAALDPRRQKVLMPSHRDTFIDIFG